MEDERLEFLLNRYFDQALSAEEKAELERMLLESGPAREVFWDLARWHGIFRQWGQEEWGRRDAVAEAAPAPPKLRVLPPPRRMAARKPVAPPRPSVPGWWPVAAAASVAIGLFCWLEFSPQFRSPAQSDPGASNGVAVLTHAGSVVWADARAAHRSGEVLAPGWLRLKSGALEIEFSRGARAVLEGPAEFQLLTDNSGTLRHGKFLVTVPGPAHGFSLRTPDFSVVDHGTQFGAIVPLAGPAEVHVFRGAVGVESAAAAGSPGQKDLRENQALRFTGGHAQDIQANPNAFITEEKLARLDNEKSRQQLAAWRQSSAQLSQHPGMLAYFDFEKASAGEMDYVLANRAPGAPGETNGTVVGCEWTEGRWPGKGALQFKRSNDRVRLSLPGQYPAMTFLAWIRADSVPFRENSLIMAESHDGLGEANWYLFRDGSLGWSARIARRGMAQQWLHIKSWPVIRAETFGSWRLAATVFDGTTVSHYFDGKLVGSEPARLPATLRLGNFEIGNWSASVPGDDPRNTSAERVDREIIGNFSGAIDELAILAVPLSAQEIERIYVEGRPGEN